MESEHLRRKNEDLEKEIEQLQADRCSDAEELVYLKWLNACLRYEVRNCQLPDGKAAAKDLSKTLSPKSEEKAKQLIIEYANTEGMGEKVINIMDSDYDQWSSSQASVLTDSGEFDYSSADNSSAIKTNRSSKAKYFRKLRRLLRGKDSHDNQVLSAEKSRSLEDADSPRYSSGTEGHSNKFTSPQGSSGLSLDLNRFKSIKEENIKDIDSFRRNSDMGSSYPYKRFADSALKSTRDRDSDANEKYELKKYADVLKESQGGKRSIRSRPASFSSV